MRGAALQKRELNAADLRAGLFFQNVGKQRRKAAELGMAEAVGCRGLCLGDEAAVRVMDALGDGDDAVAVLLVAFGHVGNELVHVEVDLGEVNKVAAGLFRVGKRSRSRQPACVAAHALDDGDLADVIDAGVARNFHDRGRNILGSRGKARAVVGTKEVVVDGLGNAHDAAVVADLLHIFRDLVAGIHGVVAAVVAEITHVVLLEDLKDALVVGVVDVGIGNLVAAGAERGGGGIGQAVELCAVFLVHAQKLVVQNALDAVVRAVDLRDAVGIKRGADDAVSGRIDNGRRAAGLADNQGTF